MEPLEMNHSAASFVRLKDSTNIIAPHVPINGKLKVIKRYQNQLLMQLNLFQCERFSKWAIMQMNNGNTVLRTSSCSPKEHDEMSIANYYSN
jgi:hypothetical protein